MTISSENCQKEPSKHSKRRFVKFILLIFIGLGVSYLAMTQGMRLNPESFKNYVLSLGIWGPLIYVGIFIIRPVFLIPSIALFIAGGLAFGPLIGPAYASIGAAMGGTVGFWIARKMGHEYVMSKLKLGSGVIDNTRFSFSVVFLLSLLPVMPVTVINYGSGLSTMKFKTYIAAHVLGMTPRAYAYGFFGSTLLEIGSPKFRGALILLVILALVTIFVRRRTRQKNNSAAQEGTSSVEAE